MIDSKQIILTTLTPLCSHGADPKKAEFRITEVKNLMRFWWRALNQFETVDEMWEKEASFFGSTECKSPLQIRRRYGEQVAINGSDNEEWLTRTSRGIYIQRFVLNFAVFNYTHPDITASIEQDKLMDYYIYLLKVATMLGGMGNRSRRGAGIVKVEIVGEPQTNSVPNTSTIFAELKSLFKNLKIDRYYHFQESTNEIKRKQNLTKIEYPYLERVIIGNRNLTKNTLQDKIRGAMANVKNIEYKKSDVKRLACPIYLSAYGEKDCLYPVVSHLYNTNPSDEYEEYKTKISNGVIL